MSGRVGSKPSQPPAVGPAPPHSLEAERAVLGGILRGPAKVVGVLSGEERLRPEHFYRDRHARIYRAMLRAYERGAKPDQVTVCDELRLAGDLEQVGETAVDELDAPVPGMGNVRRYAQIVVEQATWRGRLTATYAMQAAIGDFDEPGFIAAEGQLAHKPEGAQRAYDTIELGLAVIKRLEGSSIESFPWPFHKFNTVTRGGMRRGQVTLITGPTRHGKSVMLDMALESAATCDRKPKVGLFLNEMSAEERGLRVVARQARMSYTKLELASAGQEKLSENEYKIAYKALGAMPFEIVECAGWTATEICREARRRKYDVVGVDIIQRLPHRMESRVRELEEASNEFDRLAKETGAHVLVTAHINRGRRGLSPVVPFPSMDDIRDCAQLANDADNVLIVWREQDADTGDPLDEGIVRFSKVRGGHPGGLFVDFWGDRQSFTPNENQDERPGPTGPPVAPLRAAA